MTSTLLKEAQNYELDEECRIAEKYRPVFHLSARVGWMNDPNGFSQYGGKTHLFYQYFPYSKKWGPMHWAHATTNDFLKWEYQPAALAPDTRPDSDGCFSGSAITLDDGRHMLVYTGVVRVHNTDQDIFTQTQCIAFGDGVEYTKYEGNPVIDETMIPEGLSKYDFRDPKIFREKDGKFGLVAVACVGWFDKKGRVLYFRSDDGMKWRFVNTVIDNDDGSLGTMWECPDLFELDGTDVLILSPQDVLQDDKYFSGNIVVCMLGKLDEDCKFHKEAEQLVDYGMDFYATQTMLTEDGRRIMTAWMQNWDSIVHTHLHFRWIGQMVLPRELHVKDGKLLQQPVREIETIRKNKIEYTDLRINGKTELEGIKGRTVDLTITIKPNDTLRKFEIRLAEKGVLHTDIAYKPKEHSLKFDRSFSGTRRAIVNSRKWKSAPAEDGSMTLRIIADRYSIELFVNDGEQTASNVIYTDLEADGISFTADGEALVDITFYELSFE